MATHAFRTGKVKKRNKEGMIEKRDEKKNREIKIKKIIISYSTVEVRARYER